MAAKPASSNRRNVLRCEAPPELEDRFENIRKFQGGDKSSLMRELLEIGMQQKEAHIAQQYLVKNIDQIVAEKVLEFHNREDAQCHGSPLPKFGS